LPLSQTKTITVWMTMNRQLPMNPVTLSAIRAERRPIDQGLVDRVTMRSCHGSSFLLVGVTPGTR